MTRRMTILVLALSASSCTVHTTPEPERAPAATSAQAEANELLSLYDPILYALSTEATRAAWTASIDVSEEHTGARTGAETAFSAFAGNAEIIRRARALMEHQDELDDVTVRQIRAMLELAASAPMTNPELARARVAAESAQSARLDGFQFCLARDEAGACTQPATTNDIDGVLGESRDLDERLNAWR
ncbi:MAG: M2 family metallopeptidase, partial [Myxococcales bacterium]|nr:M2 family metallopeptidase [Myxococcales bacterium]